MVDLATGSTIWDSLDFPLVKVRAFLHVPRLNQFVLSEEANDKRGVLVVVSGSDGGRLWQWGTDIPDRFRLLDLPDDARVLANGKTDSAQRTLGSMGLAVSAEHWRPEGFLRNNARNRNALVLRATAGSARVFAALAVELGLTGSLPAMDGMPRIRSRRLSARSSAGSSETVSTKGGNGETRALVSVWRKPSLCPQAPGGSCNDAFTSIPTRPINGPRSADGNGKAIHVTRATHCDLGSRVADTDEIRNQSHVPSRFG